MEQNKILLKTKANKTFSLKTKNEQVSQNAYHRSHTHTHTHTHTNHSDAFLLYTKTSEIETKN